MLGVVVWVVAAPWPPCCPHPSPLPPSGRGDALLWEGVLLRRGLQEVAYQRALI